MPRATIRVMNRRAALLLAIVLVAFTSGAAADAANYHRLVEAAKLWAHIKYCHPGVTAADVDWDAALANVTPKILAAKDDGEFSAAIDEMLCALHDPVTRVLRPGTGMFSNLKAKPVVADQDGVTLVRMEDSSFQDARKAGAEIARIVAGKGPIVFDLRGSKSARFVLPAMSVARRSVGPTRMTRAHSGYANDANLGTGGYNSYWESRDGVSLPVAPASAIQPVFLVDRQTAIPDWALAAQASGVGAILSEAGPIVETQIDPGWQIDLGPHVAVTVRVAMAGYPDGTTGVSANAEIKETGDAALQVAIAMAKAGKWPAPLPRHKLELPPARFTENAYADQLYPSVEYRLLAAARVWGVFHYFHPYKYLYDDDWDAVLEEMFPKVENAPNALEYHKAIAEMVAHTVDSHCYMSSPALTEFFGAAPPAVELRWIEDQPVVTRVVEPGLDVKPGDVLTKIDGEPWQKRAEELRKRLAASTPQSMMGRVMGALLRGPDGSVVRVSLRRGGEEREVALTRRSDARLTPYRQGEPFRLLTPKIGYVDLEKLTNAQVDKMFDAFKGTDAIVMDMRGYPQGTAWSIAPRLAEKPGKVAATFRRNLVQPEASQDNPMMLTFQQRLLDTTGSRYAGKTVMLIDDRAISQSEHSGLFYRAANGTKFIGSGTTGANGDTTFFFAPGGIRINFTGHDVRWPDGTQLQRVGLKPDIEVKPTIAGIRNGRDEVLERAVAYLESGR